LKNIRHRQHGNGAVPPRAEGKQQLLHHLNFFGQLGEQLPIHWNAIELLLEGFGRQERIAPKLPGGYVFQAVYDWRLAGHRFHHQKTFRAVTECPL
jgi:hypothetical protein